MPSALARERYVQPYSTTPNSYIKDITGFEVFNHTTQLQKNLQARCFEKPTPSSSEHTGDPP
jgi:hypothetical protein